MIYIISNPWEDISIFIHNVQMTQHTYKNHIMTLKGLLDLNVDNEDMKDAIYKLASKSESGEEPDYDILHIENKLLAGLFYQKMFYAKKAGYNMHFEILKSRYESRLDDFDLIDIAGILIDNAIEHCFEDSQDIYVTIGQTSNSESNRFRLKVENSGPKVSSEYISNMFKRGATSKENKSGHGLGMYILKTKVNKSKGKISVYNTERDGVGMIAVEVEV